MEGTWTLKPFKPKPQTPKWSNTLEKFGLVLKGLKIYLNPNIWLGFLGIRFEVCVCVCVGGGWGGGGRVKSPRLKLVRIMLET